VSTPEPIHASTAYAYPLLIRQLLLTPIARAVDTEIVQDDGTRLRYPELVARIGRLANVLSDLGVRRGDTVAVMDWDSHRYLECYFGIPMLGAVVQTVNIRLSPEHLLYTLQHAGARTLIVNAEFLPMLAAVRAQLSGIEHIVVIGSAVAATEAGLTVSGEYAALIEAASPDFAFEDFDENTQATVFYTSGTTGLPKGVFYSHRQIVLHAMTLLGTFGTAAGHGSLSADDVYMPITPMFHVHAWGMPYAATALGLKQVYPGRYAPETLLRLIRDEGVSFCHSVPTPLQMLLGHPDSARTDLSGIKFLIGGSALPEGLARAALERGIDVFTGYGMSETGPVQTVNHLSPAERAAPLEEQARLRSRTGRPVLLCNVQVVDADLQPLPHDGQSAGEVVFRSPWLTQGYLGNPEASEELWRGGWLHSGDIGTFDPDGCLRITDRLKDVIKTGGEWVSSLLIESVISQLPGVAEVAVIAEPDAKWGERPVALVVPRPGGEAVDAEAVRAAVSAAAAAGQVPRYGVPQRVEIVEALDKTSVGKLDKKRLRQRFVNG